MRTLLPILISLLILSCQKSTDGSNSNFSMNHSPRNYINLSDVMGENCMNVKRFISEIKALYPPPRIRQITTNVVLTSSDSISHNFALRTSYLNFSFNYDSQKSISELVSTEQNDCSTISLKTNGGDLKEFNITEIKSNKIRFSADTGESFTFEWISPQHFKTAHGFITGDYLCKGDSKVYVSVEKDFAWGAEIKNESVNDDLNSNELISPYYLKSLAEAVGIDVVNLIPLTSTALLDLKQKPIDKSFWNCETQ
jgi:hypothetical protein